jgi:protocatechuate 3,4-dioxygenase, alpha subunit
MAELLSVTRTRAQGHRLPLTPAQTAGPYLRLGLSHPGMADAVPLDAPGAVRVGGVLLDGAGSPIADGLVEIWQADASGAFHHPDDPRGPVPAPEGFTGFARCLTEDCGRWSVVTVKPGPLPAPDGSTEAPHLDVSVFARGLLHRLVTRIYFPEDDATEGPGGHRADPVLASVPAERRHTLVATAVEAGYRFDIRVQGEGETVFFDV